MRKTPPRGSIAQRRRRGFTLVQLLLVITIVAALAALAFGSLRQGRAQAQLATCDANLKAVALAADTSRQAEGHFPSSLQALQEQNLLEPAILRCPADPAPQSRGYEEFYILRSPRGDQERPLLVCPFHEDRKSDSRQPGAQAFGGRFTKQHPAMHATLTQANDATVQEPGKDPVAGASGMVLRGGDRVSTGSAGLAVITFTDGSSAKLKANTDVTVLQSFVDSQVSSPTLYTLAKQASGAAVYYVNHGSKFDVATPTATAGARGTEFEIVVAQENGRSQTTLTVLEGVVAFNTIKQTTLAESGDIIEDTLKNLLNLL